MSDDQQVFVRWLAALRGFGDPEPVRLACAADAVVERLGFDASRGRVVERFTGHDQVAAWCGRSPRNVSFDLAGPVRRDGDALEARYAVRIGDFENFGSWRVLLAEDGRIAHLRHQPEDLPDEWRTGIPEGKSLGPPAPPRGPLPDHDHGHGHEHSHEHGHGSEEE